MAMRAVNQSISRKLVLFLSATLFHAAFFQRPWGCNAYQLLPPTRLETSGRKTASLLNTGSADQEGATAGAARLGFLTFDLDDTLFPTSETVRDANDAQIRHMNSRILSTSSSSPADLITVPGFLQTTREIRLHLDSSSTPVTYTTLRKMAIRQEFVKRMDDASSSKSLEFDLEAAVEQAFDVWLEERHNAAERHIFPDAVSSLQRLKERYPDVCIAAITNGRGDPLQMTDTLGQFFDFTVSGEDDGVFPDRKPHRGIYDVARKRYQELFPHHHNDESMPRIWCHVGDCLANDVGASADCGAYAVWYYPDGGEEALATAAAAARSQPQGNEQPSYSTASKKDIAKRKQLADQAEGKVATRISSLSELEFAIEELLVSASAAVSC